MAWVKNLLFRNFIKKPLIFRQFSTMKEQQIIVDNQTINYIKVGNGSNRILCFPGALGTIWSDFKPQIEGLDTSKFTVVAWDPPGYGFSRPPDRKFCPEFYENDANCAYKFMMSLGIKTFSLLGWSDGGISSMILSAKYPEAVDKLIIWGVNAYIIPKEIESYEKIRDISKWSDKMKAPLIKLYTENGLQNMWNAWCDALKEISDNGGDICKSSLSKIKCPTLILHGNKDPLVAPEHCDFLSSHIKGSRFPEGKHNIHLRYSQEFNKIVSNFISDTSKY